MPGSLGLKRSDCFADYLAIIIYLAIVYLANIVSRDSDGQRDDSRFELFWRKRCTANPALVKAPRLLNRKRTPVPLRISRSSITVS
jgi:hypothetical protein